MELILAYVRMSYISDDSLISNVSFIFQLWLCGDFKSSFCRFTNKSPMMTKQPELKLIYPSLNNVKNSHDNLLGGGCLPYSNSVHKNQPWLNEYLQ